MEQVTIFEGADGAGKTTLIEKIRCENKWVDFKIFHHGPCSGENSIARHYLASLEAARHLPTFMDRSWMSEPIYGSAFREGQDRIGVAFRRMLDRVALSLGGIV